jgi:outer membrane protein OmpA-like peptidoglycan-associated protein
MVNFIHVNEEEPMKLQSWLSGGFALASLLTANTALADLADNKTVYDRNGNVVHSLQFGNCVRTQWQAEGDICAPAEPEVVKAPEPVRTVLNKKQSVVYFEFDSAQLTPDAQANLNDVARTLRTAKDVRQLQIIGYADRIGDSSYNVDLSKKRAGSVQSYLNQQGYMNTQVTDVRGLGEANSITQCSEQTSREEEIACLSQDRRVELELQYVEPGQAMNTPQPAPNAAVQ